MSEYKVVKLEVETAISNVLIWVQETLAQAIETAASKLLKLI